MQALRSSLLSAYYYGSLPLRWWLRRRAVRRRMAPIAVLFYHRVADDRPGPWTMSCRDFARQIDWLERNFELVSLEETQRRLRNGQNDRPAVAITFDDGYADNCRYALPLLAQRRIPTTYFVTTQHILHGQPFPHDVARGAPLKPNTLSQLRELAGSTIEIGAHTRTHCDLGATRSPHKLYDEVVAAGEELQSALGRAVRY
ncbi:MAG: polysaccharide deacetylase family protein, partial [Planctomycetales bacterium]|nr:polysaccharide deacetylase family protein [Planctomycetales bacterium]